MTEDGRDRQVEPFSPTFIIGTIRIHQIEGASCFNMGNNWASDFRSYKKHNQGFGTVTGDHSTIRGTKSLLSDPDTFDLAALPGDDDIPDWIARLLPKE